jgi:hypothetical protein
VAAVGDHQEVLVHPGDVWAGQAGQERLDRHGQLRRGVKGERRVVVAFGLGTQPLTGARPRVAERPHAGEHQVPGAADGGAERPFAVQAPLVLGEAREVAAPDRPRVLLRGARVDEQLPAWAQHAHDAGQEAA